MLAAYELLREIEVLQRRLFLLLGLSLLLLAGRAAASQAAQIHLPLVFKPPESRAVQAPVLKWQRGGCYSSWCETGWYSSPAVADLDGDGQPEVIASAYSIFVLDGATGALEWRVASGHDRSRAGAPDSVGRTWPGIVVADVDEDGSAGDRHRPRRRLGLGL